MKTVNDAFHLVRRIRACEGEAAGVALVAEFSRGVADEARREEAEEWERAVADEPELPGDPPTEMLDALRDPMTAAECLRIVVRQTKEGILRRRGAKR